MDYLGQILHTGLPSTSLADFIKPPDLAEWHKVCVPSQLSLHMIVEHGKGTQGQGDTATHRGYPFQHDKEHVLPQATRRGGRERRTAGAHISSPKYRGFVCLFGF